MKKALIAVALASSFGLGVGTVVVAAPELTFKQEANAHPEIRDAIHALDKAIGHLDAAKDDFGGNKAQAITDAKAARHSLVKALFFRLKKDDNALDKANGY